MSETKPVAKISVDIYENQLPEIHVVGGAIPARMYQKMLLMLRQEYFKHNTNLSRAKQEEYEKRQRRNEDLIRKKHQEEHKKEQELNNDRRDEKEGTAGDAEGSGDATVTQEWGTSGHEEAGNTEASGDNG